MVTLKRRYMRWWRWLVLHFNTDDRTLDSLSRAILLSSCFRNQFSTLNKGWKNPLKGIKWPLKQHQPKKKKKRKGFVSFIHFPLLLLPQLLQNQNKLTQLLDKQHWHFLYCWRLSLKFHNNEWNECSILNQLSKRQYSSYVY